MLFLALALVEPGAANVEEHVAQLMAPYSMHLMVPEHRRECYCVNAEALAFGAVEADQEVGDRDELWNAHRARRSARETVWIGDALKQWDRVRDEAARAHPSWGRPRPQCGGCGGTGYYLSTDNPHGKWDSYYIKSVVPHVELPDDFGTYAMLAPDGQWRQPHRRTRAAYEAYWSECRSIMNAHPFHLAVVMGCHA